MIERFAEGEALGFRPAPREGERDFVFLSEMSVFVFPEFLKSLHTDVLQKKDN